MDKEIKKSSKIVFLGLEKGEKRIIKTLAEKGFLSLVGLDAEIQKKNFTELTFDRHGIRKRLYGSFKFSGLIKNDFVNKFPINKKETRYGLTLKGILVSLSEIDFTKIAQIKQFKEFLLKNTEDKEVVKWSLEFIKAEISLILYYNYKCGINWSRFIFLESYWDEFKEYDQNILSRFFFNTLFEEDSSYNHIREEFLKHFYLLDSTTEKITCYFNSIYTEHPIEFANSIRKYVDRWYKLVTIFDVKKKEVYSKFIDYDELPDFDIEKLEPLSRTPMRNAQKILKTHQEKIKKQTV